jgi:hypothetical protein
MGRRKNSPEEIREAVRLSNSVAGVIYLLGLGGYSASGGTETAARVSRYILEGGIDTTHFIRPVVASEFLTLPIEKPRMRKSWSLEEKREFLLKYILLNPSTTNLRPYRTLLIQLGILTDACVGCGRKTHTCFGQEVQLNLQIDHVDGNHHNNLPENLRQLCPCCHTIQETSSGNRVISKKKEPSPAQLFLDAQAALREKEQRESEKEENRWLDDGGG